MLRPYVHGDQRRRLKDAIDARTRELVLVGSARGSCIECGVDFARVTIGCRACHSRAQGRRYRQQRRAKHD